MPTSSKQLPSQERRAATIRAVIDLAGEQNPSEITTAAIARRMNLTQGALFRHFAGKAAIWEGVMDWVAEGLMDRVERSARDATGPLEALEAMFMAHAGFAAAHPGVPRMMFGELQRGEDSPAKTVARRLIRHYRERLATVIEEGKREGVIGREIDSQAAAALFIGSIQGLVMQSMLAGDPRRMIDEAPGVFAILRRGLIRRHEARAGEP